MTTKYLTFDAGDAIVISGVAYHRNASNPICHSADTTPGSGDVLDIDKYTWSRDDSNVSSGTDHRTWTACQMAVAEEINGGELEIAAEDFDVYQDLVTAPAAGIIRVWTDPSIYAGGGNGGSIKVGIAERGWYHENSDKATALPFKMQSGDLCQVKVKASAGPVTVYYAFCPYVYP